MRSGHDEALKVLYEHSVNFKNDLADLRQRVKGISSNYSKFNSKVEEFEAELKDFGRKNEQIQKEKTVSTILLGVWFVIIGYIETVWIVWGK